MAPIDHSFRASDVASRDLSRFGSSLLDLVSRLQQASAGNSQELIDCSVPLLVRSTHFTPGVLSDLDDTLGPDPLDLVGS